MPAVTLCRVWLSSGLCPIAVLEGALWELEATFVTFCRDRLKLLECNYVFMYIIVLFL
jgi:hypothetical protein